MATKSKIIEAKPEKFRILKNPTTTKVEDNFGKIHILLSGKKSLTIKGSRADLIADNLLMRYGFLQDITNRIIEERRGKNGK